VTTTSTVAPTTTNPPAAVASTLPSAPPSTVSLLAATAPTAPRSPVATRGNAWVKLTWLAPSSSGGAPVDKYAVQQWTGLGWKNVAYPAGTGYTVRNLVNGTKYVFRVVAHNAAGWSPASTTVSAVPRTVPSAPRSPVATRGNASVKLTWLAPSSSGGAPVDKYDVQQWTGLGWKNVAYAAGQGYTVTNLVNGSKYVFRVVAHNAAGWSPASTTVSAVPRTVPSAPLQCEAFNMGGDPHTLVVTWHPPASDGGAPIDFGEVHVIQNGAFVEGAWSAKGLVVTSLPYGAYEVRVRSYNAAGAGPWCTVGIWLFP
jgi:titin